MPPKGWPSAPKAGTACIVQLTCLCLLFSHFAASQPLPEVVVPGINPFYAAPPRKKPGPPQSLPFQAGGVENEFLPSQASVLPEAAPRVPEQQTLPCACTSTGMSGTVNTSTVGCGQWLIAEGSNVFICYITDPEMCTGFTDIARSARFPGAYFKVCRSERAALEGNLPPLGTLLSTVPQIQDFYRLIHLSNFTSIPGEDITVLAPSDDALATAVNQGTLLPLSSQTQDSALQLVLASIIPVAGIKSEALAALQTVTLANNQTVRTGIQRNEPGVDSSLLQRGNLVVDGAVVDVPDILATNGVLHIMDGVIGVTAGHSTPDIVERVPVAGDSVVLEPAVSPSSMLLPPFVPPQEVPQSPPPMLSPPIPPLDVPSPPSRSPPPPVLQRKLPPAPAAPAPARPVAVATSPLTIPPLEEPPPPRSLPPMPSPPPPDFTRQIEEARRRVDQQRQELELRREEERRQEEEERRREEERIREEQKRLEEERRREEQERQAEEQRRQEEERRIAAQTPPPRSPPPSSPSPPPPSPPVPLLSIQDVFADFFPLQQQQQQQEFQQAAQQPTFLPAQRIADFQAE